MFADLSYCGGYPLHQDILKPHSAFYELIELGFFSDTPWSNYKFALYFCVYSYNLKEGNKKKYKYNFTQYIKNILNRNTELETTKTFFFYYKVTYLIDDGLTKL